MTPVCVTPSAPAITSPDCTKVMPSSSSTAASWLRVAARLFPLGRLEIDKQAVGCGQVDGILVVSSRELVLEVSPKCTKTTTVGSLQESQSKSAVTRNLDAFCCVVCVGQDSGSSIQ